MNKTIVNNWTGGGTLQTWTDGEWQILYAKDSAGNCVTLSLTSSDAVRLAYAVSPTPGEQHERLRAANDAVYELSYPEARADELRQIADEIDCDGGCEGCSPQKLDRGEFCCFVSAENLRKLASALDLKAKVDASRPDAGSGVRALPDWQQHNLGQIIKKLTNWRNEDHEDTTVIWRSDVCTILDALALSTPSDAVNESAEARLREALTDIAAISACVAVVADPTSHVKMLSNINTVSMKALKALSADGQTVQAINGPFASASPAGGDEATKSEGRRENQPEGCTGPHRESGETNSGSTGDSILTRSAVRLSEPTADRRVADDVVAYLHRSKFGHANELSFEVATNPDWTSEPLGHLPEKAAGVSNPDRREIVAQSSAWPAHCYSPNSCERHRQCMYIGCVWRGTDIKAALEGGR